jgi:hypothetical protein
MTWRPGELAMVVPLKKARVGNADKGGAGKLH